MPTCLIAYQFDISYVCRFLSILAAMIIICSDIRSTTGRMLVYMLHINAECLPTARLTASALASPIAICFLIAPSQQLSRVRLDSIISNNTKMAAKKDMRRLDLGKQCFIWLHISVTVADIESRPAIPYIEPPTSKNDADVSGMELLCQRMLW